MVAPPTPCAYPDLLILVDEHDRAIGYAAKLPAHQNGGLLHRAFSIFIFNPAGQMLLQRRAPGKYHFGGLWTNACCSHPRKGEQLLDAARARLRLEFGFDTELTELFSFVYRAADPATGLTENEFDHVLRGTCAADPRPNPDEIAEFKWISPPDLQADVNSNPHHYTPWFKLILRRVLDQP